jgi:ElaB/YqjD/DUF883 family membrane-anchored ribosome-binding protein
VDCIWLPDPLAKETVANPFGEKNSALKMPSAREESRLASGGLLQKANNNKYEEQNIMNKQTQAVNDAIGTLAEDARALMAATADVAGEKVSEARKRLAAALESGKEVYGRVREKAVEGAKVADEAVHEHPYQAIGIALGAGALIGYLVARRCSHNGD